MKLQGISIRLTANRHSNALEFNLVVDRDQGTGPVPVHRGASLLSVQRQNYGANVHRVAEGREEGRVVGVSSLRLRGLQHFTDSKVHFTGVRN